MAGQFVLTNAGLAQATLAASPGGVKMLIPTFKLGAGTGYTPTAAHTALVGTTLYTGLVSGYVKQPDGSLLVSCVVPADAGPFTFGEIGLYNDSNTLIALACLPDPISKVSSLGAGFGATYTFNGLLKLGTASVTIDITPAGPMSYPVQYVTSWAALDPYPLGGPQMYTTIISEADNKGDYSTAVRTSSGGWSIQSNFRANRLVATINGVAANKSWITISLADWLALCPGDTSLAKATSTSFVVQSPNGYFCSAVPSLAGSNVQFTFSENFTKSNLAIGQPLRLWSNYAL